MCQIEPTPRPRSPAQPIPWQSHSARSCFSGPSPISLSALPFCLLNSCLVCAAPQDLRNWRGLPKLELARLASLCHQCDCSWRVIRRYCRERRKGTRQKMGSTADSPIVRTVASTQSEMTEIVLPNDANTLGNLLGGRLMHFIDLTGAIAAYRHTRTHVVTAAMDHIDFIQPVHVGDLLILKSSVNRAFNTSVEVGVKVWVEHPQTGVLLQIGRAS